MPELRARQLTKRFSGIAVVKDVDAYRKSTKAAGKGKSVLFLVRRGDNTIFLAVKPTG